MSANFRHALIFGAGLAIGMSLGQYGLDRLRALLVAR